MYDSVSILQDSSATVFDQYLLLFYTSSYGLLYCHLQEDIDILSLLFLFFLVYICQTGTMECS